MPAASASAAPVVAVISQKGGAGKTMLALHLAVAVHEASRVALVVDCDPQATASQWAAWRQDAPPEVIDSPPPRVAAKVAAAREQGANFIVIDTPPMPTAPRALRSRPRTRADSMPPLGLLPCRDPDQCEAR